VVVHVGLLIWMLIIQRILENGVLNYQLKQGRILKYNCSNKENAFKLFMFLTGLFIFIYGIVMENIVMGLEEVHQFIILRQWILIELCSLLIEPFYFFIFLRAINTVSNIQSL
jgi:hypothetical protein